MAQTEPTHAYFWVTEHQTRGLMHMHATCYMDARDWSCLDAYVYCAKYMSK